MRTEICEHFLSGDGTRVAAVSAVFHAPRVVQVLRPELTDDQDASAAVRVLKRLGDRLARDGVRVAHVHLATDDAVAAAWFRECGYLPLDDVLTLAATAEDTDTPTSLRFRRCQPTDRPQLLAILQQCWQNTQDSPFLDDLLTPQDAIEGYATTGDSGSDLWHIAADGRRAVGCVLLTNHHRESVCELLYMGLIPEARGRKLGRDLVRHSRKVCRQRGSSRLVTTVDAGNDRALAVYSRLGFVVTARHAAFVRRCCGGNSARADRVQA